MKNKNIVLTISGILIVILFTLGLVYHFRDRRTYELNIPQIDEISKIELEKNAEGVVLFQREEIKDIRNVLLRSKKNNRN